MALSYADVQRYSDAIKAITGGASADVSAAMADAMSGNVTRGRMLAAMRQASRRYLESARELGAQWYEYAADEAGEDVDPALMDEYSYEGFDRRLGAAIDGYLDGEMDFARFDRAVQEAIEDEVRNAARQEVISNLDRDARADRRSGRKERAGYARVPVGETCAWCFMLASLGYYYRSYESAGGVDPDHYHLHCDCVVVPYSGPDAIEGYDDYERYKEMYDRANDARKSGGYSDEMARKIRAAEERHTKEYKEHLKRKEKDPNATGRVTQPWTPYNETLMLMREQNGLKH